MKKVIVTILAVLVGGTIAYSQLGVKAYTAKFNECFTSVAEFNKHSVDVPTYADSYREETAQEKTDSHSCPNGYLVEVSKDFLTLKEAQEYLAPMKIGKVYQGTSLVALYRKAYAAPIDNMNGLTSGSIVDQNTGSGWTTAYTPCHANFSREDTVIYEGAHAVNMSGSSV